MNTPAQRGRTQGTRRVCVGIGMVAACGFAIHAARLLPPASAQDGKAVLSQCFVPDARLMQQYKDALARRQEAADHTERRVIYGCDDRKNFYDARLTEQQRRAAGTTAIVIHHNQLVERGRNLFNLRSRDSGLCSPEEIVRYQYPIPERFWDEPAPGFCSSFKVGRRLIATAGHCVTSELACRGDGSERNPGVSFVFGFRMANADAHPDQGIPKSEVYHCVRVVGGSTEVEPGQADWRVVEVDRDIDAPQVELSQGAADLHRGTEVTVVGYPLGLPVKISDHAAVDRVTDPYFVANLDTYGGNSGSPVFNSNRLAAGQLVVEGILVRGEQDFYESDFRCHVSKRCPDEGCAGERVTQISEIAKALNR